MIRVFTVVITALGCEKGVNDYRSNKIGNKNTLNGESTEHGSHIFTAD